MSSNRLPKNIPSDVRPKRLAADRAFRRSLYERALLRGDRVDTAAPLAYSGSGDRKNVLHPGLPADKLAGSNEGRMGPGARDSLLHAKAEHKAPFYPAQALPTQSSVPQSRDMPPITTSLDVARLFDEAVEARGITNAAIAKACGVSPQAVGQWRKTGRIAKKHLSCIAALLEIPVTYFLGDDAIPRSSNPRQAEQDREMESKLLLIFRALSPEARHQLLHTASSMYAKHYNEAPPPPPVANPGAPMLVHKTASKR